MSSGSKSKQSVRGAKPQVRGAKSRRAPVRSQSNVPVLPFVVGGILLALFIGLLIYGAINNKTSTGTTPPTVVGSTTSIPCDHLEQSTIHYHSALQIMYQGNVVNLPAGTGIQGGEAAAQCFYWLHVHASSPNVIHIESPSQDTFTLGDFMKVWDAFNAFNGKTRIKLDGTHVATFTLQPGESIVTYVDLNDGKGPKVYEGDPNKIQLKSHEVITIEITSSEFPAKTPPSFTFAQGL